MATFASAFITWANPREIIEYEHDVHGDIVINEDGSKKILSSTPSFLASLTEQEICDLVLKMWVDSKPGRIGAVTYCVSGTGFHHLHMVLEVENADSDRFTYKQIQKLYGKKFHIESTRGSKADAEDYIYKRGRFAEKDEKVLAMAKIGNIQGNRGKRNDLIAMEKMLTEGMNPQQILDEVGLSAYKYKRMLQEAYAHKVEKEVGTYRQVTVYYHTGASWTGKSHIMKELIAEHGAENVYCVIDYERGCWDKYEGQKFLVLDELRAHSFRYSILLAVLNNYVLDIGARYENKKMLWSEVHITSVFPPEEIYKQMVDMHDRQYDTFDQLRNRIDFVVYHWTEGEKEKKQFLKYTLPMQEYHDYASIKYKALHQQEDEKGFAKATPEEIEYVQQFLF